MVKRVILTMLALLLISACGGGSREPNQGTVVVYVAVPLSGFQANGGQTVLGGVRLAAAEINHSGGLLGFRVEVRPLDDESDSDVAVEQVSQVEEALRSGETVLAVIGHLNSGQTLAAMELYRNLDLLVITPTASEESLSQRGYDNFFRVNANDAVQAAVDAEFLTATLQARRIAVIHNDTAYGQGLAASLVRELGQRRAEVVVQIQVQEGQSRYADEVAQVQAANPDAIFYAGYEIEAPFLRAALVQAGVTVPMLASDGAFLAATIDDADGSAEGLYVSAFAPSPATVANASWLEAYQAVEYRNPDTYSVNGYAAMQVLKEAVQKASSLDAAKIADTLRSATLDTLLGQLRYQPDGDLQNPQIWIYQVVDGEFKQVQ